MTTARQQAGVGLIPDAAAPILQISGLTVVSRDKPTVHIVDDVSLTLRRGEALGIAGESGCGKTTTALAIMGLLSGGLKRTSGELTFFGRNGTKPLHKLSGAAMRKVRWASISMVFQGAMNALDPVKTVGAQIAEAIVLHEPRLSRSAVLKRVSQLLDQVGVASKRSVYYPHEFSGGQKQRLMIALALACRPELVIADEPTTALDVITQAQILDLIGELRRELGLSLLMITHDLAVLAQACEKIAVMYAGQVVETGRVEDVYRFPQHPYTARLLDLLGADDAPGTLPEPIPGNQPRPDARPVACRFHDRCAFATERCATEAPLLREVSPQGMVTDHWARCHYSPWAGGRVPDRPAGTATVDGKQEVL
ncbi:MAG: ABC transporter ATP-binding protein [Nakamurella sp.]